MQVVNNALRSFLPLKPDALLAAARRRAKGLDFHDRGFEEALDRLCTALEQEADLTPVGRLAARHDLVRLLENRLWIEAERRRHPAIAEHNIAAPVFIIGLPRTGTTLLHNLMACDPGNRVPQTWEVMLPYPPPAPATASNDPRIATADRRLAWLHRLAPDFKVIHPLDARLPQECIAILAHSFLSNQFETMYRVPGYQAWLDSQDMTPAYRYHRVFLQHLQARDPERCWVLKAPAHLGALAALFAVYPDARVVMTHRPPLDVIASLASLISCLRGAFSRSVEPHAIGAEVSRRWAAIMTRAIAERQRLEAAGKIFVDLHYDDFMADPVAAVARLYGRLGRDLSAPARARMQDFLKHNPRNKHGAHRYTLAAFGLDAQREAGRFGAYCTRFDLPPVSRCN